MPLRRAALIATLLLALPCAFACDTPVYRYALENWEPQSYTLVLFQRGAAPDTETDRIRQRLDGSNANVSVSVVDASAPIPADFRAAWGSCTDKPLPWMVVCFPGTSGADAPLWSAAFTDENITRLLDSPLRKKLTQCARDGNAAEWILVDSGQKAADDAAAERMQTALKIISGSGVGVPARAPLTPNPSPQSGEGDRSGDPDSAAPAPIKLALLRVAANDPHEAMLLKMLAQAGKDAESSNAEPRAYLLFGRGRVLGPMTGEQIGVANIQAACAFLNGPCLCEIKEQNPGMDLLMDVDWHAMFSARHALTSDSAQPDDPASNAASVPASSTAPQPAKRAGATPPQSTPSAAAAAASPGRPTSIATLTLERDHFRLPLLAAAMVLAGLLLVWLSSRGTRRS